jgi:hypothetical protein
MEKWRIWEGRRKVMQMVTSEARFLSQGLRDGDELEVISVAV